MFCMNSCEFTQILHEIAKIKYAKFILKKFAKIK